MDKNSNANSEKKDQWIWVDVVYKVKEGKVKEFYSKIVEQNIAVDSRNEPGNRRYDYSIPLEGDNELWLTEIWTGADAVREHGNAPHFAKLGLLKKEYVEDAKISRNWILPYEI